MQLLFEREGEDGVSSCDRAALAGGVTSTYEGRVLDNGQ